MSFYKFFSTFILLLSIFVISHADENEDQESDEDDVDENSSEDDVNENSSEDDVNENSSEDDEDKAVQQAIGDILLPKGFSVQNSASGQDMSMMPPPSMWPNGHVYYEMDDSVGEVLRNMIYEAFEIWKSGSCLSFTEGCEGHHCVKVTTTNPAGQPTPCYSETGAVPGGQILNLGSICEEPKIVIHEIGHALGFLHEMNRVDRDNFMIVNEHNLIPEIKWFFGKFGADDDTDYDFTSIMQYEPNMASVDSLANTMVSLNPHYQHLIGTSVLPSFRDFYRLNEMYSCSAECPNSDLHCENGGFLSYKGDGNECTCECPPRIEGSTCEQVPEGYDYYDVPSCSQNVTEETVIQTPNYPVLSQPPERCSWWIQAPEGNQVQVEFEDFSFSTDCNADFVEIRYEDIYNGDMACGEKLKGETFTSTTNAFVIIIAGKDDRARSDDLRGLSAKVTFI